MGDRTHSDCSSNRGGRADPHAPGITLLPAPAAAAMPHHRESRRTTKR